MAEPVLYHLDQQTAPGLLRPVAYDLQRLEQRLAHYLVHLRLSERDRATVAEAHRVLAEAADALARLWQGHGHTEEGA
jgi:hypothetical protein